MPPLLRVRGLTIEFPHELGWRRVLDGLDFDVGRAEFVGLTGDSGSGKTLTSLVLIGLLQAPARATAAELRLQDLDLKPFDDESWRRVRGRRIGWVAQEPAAALNPVRTVGGQMVEVLRRHLALDRRTARAAALEWFRRVALEDPVRSLSAYPHELSGGQRQRAALALALAAKPDLLVADEPTTALDDELKIEILDLLDVLRDQLGLAVLHISHEVRLLDDRCDRVIRIPHAPTPS